VTVIIVGLLVWARTILIPLAFSVFLTFVLGPAVNKLRSWRLGRLPSVLLVVTTAMIIAGTVGWFVSLEMSAMVQELPDHAGKIRAKLELARTYLEPNPDGAFSIFIREIEDTLWPSQSNDGAAQPLPVVIASGQPSWIGQIEGLLSYGTEAAGQCALSFLLVIFLLHSRENMRNRIIRLFGSHRLTATTKAVDDAGARISRYLRIQLLLNTLFGITLAIFLWLIGIRYAILWGFFSGLMRYVPYVGTVIGLLPPLLAAIAMSEGWSQPLQVFAAYVSVEVLFNTALEPHLFGKSLGLSEVAQVFSAAFWAFLWGPVGLVLSGPLTACLLVVAKNAPQMHGLVVLLGDEDPLPPAVAFFQRLAARDRDEAEFIASDFSKTNAPDRAIDELLLPALGKAQTAVEHGEFTREDEDYIVRTVGEIADDLADGIPTSPAEKDYAPIRLLIVAIGGQGDVLAGELLARRLDHNCWDIVQLTNTSLASDILNAIREDEPAIVIIVALAPTGISAIRYLSKRLGAIGTSLKRVVGRWGGAVPPEDQDALKELGIDEVTTDLTATVQLLKAWRTMLSSAPPSSKATTNSPSDQQVGTLSAV
jgi:predicted PurR-regulated permease PerM/methylmalonyl-CoA mutase cobalamin-binding subunit